jgi:hypothetical protein
MAAVIVLFNTMPPAHQQHNDQSTEADRPPARLQNVAAIGQL